MSNPRRHTPRLPHSAFFDRVVPILLVAMVVLLLIVLAVLIVWPAAGTG